MPWFKKRQLTQDTATPAASQPFPDGVVIHAMPEQFLALTRAAKLPVAPFPQPVVAVPPAEPAPKQLGEMGLSPFSDPGKGTKSLYVPSEPEQSAETGDLFEGGAEAAAPSAEAKPAAPASETIASKIPVSRTMTKVWCALAAVILLGGGIAVFLAFRATPTPPPAPIAVVLIPTPPLPPSPPPESTPEPPPPPPPFDSDRDADGLNDATEALFGTNPGETDSDADGYPDALEVQNLYNPAGIAPQRLLDAGLVYRYEHPRDGWSILLPKQWSIAATDETQQQVVIRTEYPGEEMVVTVQENAKRLPLREWFTASMDGLEEGGTGSSARDIRTKSGSAGLLGIGAPAGFPIAWFSIARDRVLQLQYRATMNGIRYADVFDMIVQSMVIPAAIR